MPRSWRAVCILLLFLLPGLAQAHGEDGDLLPEEEASPDGGAAQSGYTGASREPYLSYVEGAWFYGKTAVTPLGHQVPRSMVTDGDWLVWEDAARADIYVFHIPTGQGYYLQADDIIQRRPAISGNHIVYEQYDRGARADIYHHDLESAARERLTPGTGGSYRTPSIDGNLVAWSQTNQDEGDIVVYDITDGQTWMAANTTAREVDPLIMGRHVFYRALSLSVWNIRGYDLAEDRSFQVTADTARQTAPFTNGTHILYLQQYFTAFKISAYDPQLERRFETPVGRSDASPTPASGQHMIGVARDGDDSQVVAVNLTTGRGTHVTGGLRLAGDYTLSGRTAFVPVRTEAGTSLVRFDITPFAFGAEPRLAITSHNRIATWTRPLTITGLFNMPSGYTEPLTFTYRIGDGAPVTVPAQPNWAITVDPAGYNPGQYVLTMRATFREGPPLTTGLLLSVPLPIAPLDVESASQSFHAARVAAELDRFIWSNPGGLGIVLIALILIIIIVVRVWFIIMAARRRRVDRGVEYVMPDE